MRPVVRILSTGLGVVMLALPLSLIQGGATGAAQAHALAAPAQVSASNWSTMPSTDTPSATGADTGVSCVTSVFCMAIGNGFYPDTGASTADLWNGTTWTPLTMPTISTAGSGPPVLSDVSCVTTSFCTAVGYIYYPSSYTALIEQWNGSSWSVVQGSVAPTTANYLVGVTCTSTTFCVAAGGIGPSGDNQAPYVVQWNGTTWSPTSLSLPTGSSDAYLNAVSCSTISFCMAVGAAGPSTSQQLPLAELWNGASWSVTSVPPVSGSPNYGLDDVSCAGTSFCAAVSGAAGVNVVNTWNGSSWALDTVPTPTGGGSLYGVSCFSATSCSAVGPAGSNNAPQALNFDGQTWSAATMPAGPASSTGHYYIAVDCLTNWACVAVGIADMPSSMFQPIQAMAPIWRSGYRFVASDGGIFNYGPSSGGGAPFLGSMGGQHLNAPIVGMATMPAGDGYYLVAADGGIFNFGSAQFYGSTGSIHLNKPVVGMAVTPDGGGYWLVASDGGVFNYGDAAFYGSMGGHPLNKPIVGLAATPNGNGYYEVASDGGIFAFPTGSSGPPFLGSTGSLTLNKPVVGMAVTPAGQYYLVASDGGIFSFPTGPNGPPFFGSTGAIKLNQPVVGMTVAAGGAGYYLGAADGGIFSFPAGAQGPVFFGSRGGQPLNAPIVGIAG